MTQAEEKKLLSGCEEGMRPGVLRLLRGQGFCAANAHITIAGHALCFTGRSARARREDIARTVEALGGTFQRRVTRGTDYLVVGEHGSPSWAHDTYGRKIRSASHLKAARQKPLIVREADFWTACEREGTKPEKSGIISTSTMAKSLEQLRREMQQKQETIAAACQQYQG